MLMNQSEQKELYELLGFNYYRKNVEILKRVLRSSRFPLLKHNGLILAILQRHLIEILIDFQKAVRDGRKVAKSISDEDERRLIVKTRNANRHLVRIVQTIADGIAWRNLNFNRPLIRLFSDNASPGHINNTIDKKTALAIEGNLREIVIVNDLTQCLRISDFLLITRDKRYILYEAKKGIDRLKNTTDILKELDKHHRNPTRQELRQIMAQSSIINDKIDVLSIENDGEIKVDHSINIVKIDISIKTHFAQMKKLIKKANRKGQAFAELEDGYFVRIQALDAIVKKTVKQNGDNSLIESLNEEYQSTRPPWLSKPNEFISICSFDSFINKGGHYSRNLLPYSVLPFTTPDCLRLMSGQLRIDTFFRYQNLRELLQSLGWAVEDGAILKKLQDHTTEKDTEHNDRVIFKKDQDESLYVIKRKINGGTYTAQVLLTEIIKMMSSFYRTDYFLDLLEFLYKRREIQAGQSYVAPFFIREREVLI